MDGLERAGMLAILQRAVKVAAAAQAAFAQGADVQFNGWAAMVAPHAPPETRRWALLRVDVSGVQRMRSHVAPSFHVVPLQVPPCVRHCCMPLSVPVSMCPWQAAIPVVVGVWSLK